MSRVRSLVVVPAAVVLLLSGCGGGSEGTSDEAKPYVDAMTKSILEEDGDEVLFKEKQARCFSERMINVVGLDKFEAAGTPEEFADDSDDLDFSSLDLTTEQGEEIYANFDKCGVDVREAMLAEMTADEDLDTASKACMENAITDENLEAFIVASMVEGEDAATESEGGKAFVGAMMGCMFAGMSEDSEE